MVQGGSTERVRITRGTSECRNIPAPRPRPNFWESTGTTALKEEDKGGVNSQMCVKRDSGGGKRSSQPNFSTKERSREGRDLEEPRYHRAARDEIALAGGVAGKRKRGRARHSCPTIMPVSPPSHADAIESSRAQQIRSGKKEEVRGSQKYTSRRNPSWKVTGKRCYVCLCREMGEKIHLQVGSVGKGFERRSSGKRWNIRDTLRLVLRG